MLFIWGHKQRIAIYTSPFGEAMSTGDLEDVVFPVILIGSRVDNEGHFEVRRT